MWWRFLTFCLLVSLILIIVLSYLHGRPVVHLFFKRCCDEDIENDEVIFENFANNYLRERLMAFDIIVDNSNGTFVPSEVDIEEIIDMMREKLNVHDPKSRRFLEEYEDLEEKINGAKELDQFVPMSGKSDKNNNRTLIISETKELVVITSTESTENDEITTMTLNDSSQTIK